MMPLQQSSQAETDLEHEPEPGTLDEAADEAAPELPSVLLRGTRAGLEIVIDASASIDEIASELTSRLEQSPGFFAGNDACVRVQGRLPVGALARLEQVTSHFDLRIVEIGPPRRAAGPDPVPDDRDGARARGDLDVGVGPGPDPAAPVWSPPTAQSNTGRVRAPAQGNTGRYEAPALASEPSSAARTVMGPIRSGIVLDAEGDLIIVGDVNPGAEIQARGNIIVLGRLRGIAHAAVGSECGFIFALRFEPQQLRIGRLVARAGESDAPGEGAEIAYATGRTIVVERYQGRVPSGPSAAA